MSTKWSRLVLSFGIRVTARFMTAIDGRMGYSRNASLSSVVQAFYDPSVATRAC
ncbi:MAG TPA: hypothetical protein VEI57_16060 [Nitrospirota bacterium]|nr:hypothetical protein [Nitrospirota bacterium]